ncbi:MAG: FAD-dependent oxidoreductase, partial [Candidatus Sungiibacteriota bacterium]
EEKLSGKGVAYCATCDAPLFSDKKVVVIGGGNAGLEAVVDLFPYASEVYLLDHGAALKGDPVIQEEIKKNTKLKSVIFNAETLEIIGDKFVSGLKYKDIKTGEEKTLNVDGIFVEIGSIPNSDMVKGLVEIDKWGQVVIDSKHASTSHPGIFAAGDISNDPYKQNNISAGDAIKAALAAYAYILKRDKQSPAAEK